MTRFAKHVLILAALCLAACEAQDTATNDVKKPSYGVAPSIWQQSFSPDVPYYNISAKPVVARLSPELSSPPVGSIAPKNGGFIKTCTAAADWCEIGFGGKGQTGWVDMKAFGGFAN